MQQGHYANPSVSSMSLDQSKQSDSPNGKITPAVFFSLMPNRSFLNFENAKWQCLFCLIRQKHCWNYFAFNQLYLAKGKLAYIGRSGLDRPDDFPKFADQDLIGFNFIGSGLDSD